MNHQPYQFILHHTDADLQRCLGFVHRTFNDTDLLYFIQFLKYHYQNSDTLETAFYPLNAENWNMEQMLIHFKQYFFSLENAPQRTKKHIASPTTKSTCKRLNMFLRWMVRTKGPVDFGLWHRIQAKDLVCPIDVHVARVARKFGLLMHTKDDWKAALELTANLKILDANDPVKYDLVLFGLGVSQEI